MSAEEKEVEPVQEKMEELLNKLRSKRFSILSDEALNLLVAADVCEYAPTDDPDACTETEVKQVWYCARRNQTVISKPYAVLRVPDDEPNSRKRLAYCHSWSRATFASSLDATLPYVYLLGNFTVNYKAFRGKFVQLHFGAQNRQITGLHERLPRMISEALLDNNDDTRADSYGNGL